MALDQNDVTFATWADAEIAAGVAGRTSLFEKLVQDLIVAKNLISSVLDVPWADDDIREHFELDFPALNKLSESACVHNADGHYQQVQVVGATAAWFQTVGTRRADRVPTFLKARVKAEEFSANCLPYVGFSVDPTADHPGVSAGAWFEKGGTSNTWLAKTRSSSTDRTTTDLLAGNYTAWDVLGVDFGASSVKFYINDALVATHTVSLPTSVALYGMVRAEGTNKSIYCDYFTWKQTTNPVSP